MQWESIASLWRSVRCGMLLIVGSMLLGCQQSPTPEQRTSIVAALCQYEKATDAETRRPATQPAATMPPATRPDSLVRLLNVTKVEVSDERATVKYDLSGTGSQFGSIPMKAKLQAKAGQWAVLETHEDWPWWWDIVDNTVGVK